MMVKRLASLFASVALALLTLAGPAAAAGSCKLQKLLELPVTMVERRPDALDKALEDCNAALRMVNTASFLDSRGLVYLRQGKLDKAIADYDAALKAKPDLAWSRYGRGLAETRKGDAAAGKSDMDAAVALEPDITTKLKDYGLAP